MGFLRTRTWLSTSHTTIWRVLFPKNLVALMIWPFICEWIKSKNCPLSCAASQSGMAATLVSTVAMPFSVHRDTRQILVAKVPALLAACNVTKQMNDFMDSLTVPATRFIKNHLLLESTLGGRFLLRFWQPHSFCHSSSITCYNSTELNKALLFDGRKRE